MSKQKKPELPPLPPLPRQDTATFSVRFTDEQRDLITKAAAVRGWSAANLLRLAALEKAAFVLNTASPNQIDFQDIARKVADRVFTQRTALVPNQSEAPAGGLVEAQTYERIEPEGWDPSEPIAQIAPWQMPPEFVEQLRLAARYGGTEFLNLLVEASQGIAIRRNPKSLPPPIDPASVGKE